MTNIDVNTAVEMCTLLKPHLSKDVMTPVLKNIWLNCGIAYVTDRYTLARFVYSEACGENLLLPAEAVEWVLKLPLKKFADGTTLGITPLTESKMRVQVMTPEHEAERMQTFELSHAQQRFPPVERLFEHRLSENGQPQPDESPLSVQQLTKITSAVQKAYGKDATLIIEASDASGAKPDATLVKIVGHDRFMALLQPNRVKA